ncbi:hypothetical protein E2C01_031343 [Portunus trituberculatus]|uniref:Uncharacterized protein n=1 Tax=Portunus trituberculatus TaxID=210409 RepID=A0A5B7EXV4_PORTR|nr:hypothetical protein [Portunus trituberculatus]
MAGKRFVEAYKSFFNPKPVSPPFLHVCQVGDPVLRTATKPVVLECLDSPEIKQRRLSGEIKESSESESVSEPQASTSVFTGITRGKMLPDVFMDGDLSSDDLPPPPTLLPSSSKLSITSLHLHMILLEFSPKRKEQFGADVYAAREMSTLPLTWTLESAVLDAAHMVQYHTSGNISEELRLICNKGNILDKIMLLI